MITPLANKISRLFFTVRFLKPKQIIYQLKYRLFKVKSIASYAPVAEPVVRPLNFTFEISQSNIVTDGSSFEFLNLKHTFSNSIDWDFQGYGKLWNYNLQYFNYLQQPDVSDEYKTTWLRDIGKWLRTGRLKPEPYPTSLRIINTIRFLSKLQNIDSEILKELYAQASFLNANLEYHILGNHLLENGFALLMSGYFFNEKDWSDTAKQLLRHELNEQILSDGAHFELSPMYHQIILFRVLELIDWYSGIECNDSAFLDFLKDKAVVMLQWLRHITFKNGDIPHFNDSATGIASTTVELFEFAKLLDLNLNGVKPLSESGYRKYQFGSYEMVIDVGAAGPTYQPGHSHADALSFVLYFNNNPFIVDAGTSTYQIGDRRNYERSTSAHNTVEVNGTNQSDVWGGFRLGKRANVLISKDTEDSLEASHNGYQQNFGITHKRTFNLTPGAIAITDLVIGDISTSNEARLHFYPGITLNKTADNEISIDGIGNIRFNGALQINFSKYQLANGYNKYLCADLLIVEFVNQLETVLTFN